MQINKISLVGIKSAILMAAAFVIISCGSQLSEQQMIQTAKAYLEENKLRPAAIELKNILQGNPNNAEARYLLGKVNLDVGDMASAEKEFRRAIDAGWLEEQAKIGIAVSMINQKAFQKVINEIEVKDNYSASARADLYGLKALAHAGNGDMDKAKVILSRGAEIDAKAFYIMKSSIQIQLAGNDIDEATQQIKQTLVVYGDNQEILLLNANILTQNKAYKKAIAVYQKVIKLDPPVLITVYGQRARLGLARLEILDKNLDLAEATLAPLFKQNASDLETNFVGGLLAFEQGKLGLAEERLLLVLRVAPEHVPTQLLFGTVNYAQQDYEQAAYYIARYVSAVPGNMNARKLLGRTYIKLGQHEDARVILQSGLDESSENDAELLALVGLSQLQAGDTASGIAGLEKAVKVAPESSALKSELAKAYISAGETENAIKQLNTILAKGGDKKKTQNLLIAAHLKAGQFDQAIDIVLGMVQKNPDDPAVLSLAGNVFVLSNDRTEARKYFNKALQVKSEYAPAMLLLARLEELEGQPEIAEKLYTKLVKSDTDDIAPMMALARLAETQKQAGKMVAWLEKARLAAPNDIRPLKALAEHNLRSGQLEKAGLLIKESVKIAPRDNTLLLMQARLQMAEGQNNKALASLNELITRVPDSVFVRTMLGEVYFRLNQLTEAKRQLSIVLEKQAYYTSALVLMGNLELKSGNNEQALEYAVQIQKTEPDFYMGYYLAGDALMLREDYSAAKSSYKQAWQHKRFSELAIKFSETSTRVGKYKEATKPLLTWLSENPDDVRVLQFLGTTYQNMENNTKTIETFEKVLTIQPDNIVALNNLAWLYSLANNSKALALAERAYSINPDDSGVQDTYGWVLVQQGQVEKGRRILEQVVKDLPDVPEVQYHYAVALIKSGEKIHARKVLGKLLKSSKPFVGRKEAEQLMK